MFFIRQNFVVKRTYVECESARSRSGSALWCVSKKISYDKTVIELKITFLMKNSSNYQERVEIDHCENLAYLVIESKWPTKGFNESAPLCVMVSCVVEFLDGVYKINDIFE